MSSTFTPSDAIDMSKERDWPANLGMLDWDSTSIVFTKRSLIEFLKYTGTTVDTNYNNIAKLPRYARFGKISDGASPAPAAPQAAESAASTAQPAQDTFKPTRRVRTAPGGPTSELFAHEEDDDALSQAPPPTGSTPQRTAAPAAAEEEEEEHQGLAMPSAPRPSRRVREQPGGKDSLANFWDSNETDEFKPTRRVREGPGGRDSISQLF